MKKSTVGIYFRRGKWHWNIKSDGFETLAEAVVDARQKVKASTVQMPDILKDEPREENSSTNGN